MNIFVFNCSVRKSRYGLTKDETGGNFPEASCDGGIWNFDRTIEVSLNNPPFLSGLTAKQILDAINSDGYLVVDISVVFTERAGE